jgi:acetyltransferase-like isoleucine patch superfamily enzyme
MALNLKRLLSGNPHNLTRLHLKAGVERWGWQIGDFSYGAPKVRFADADAGLSIGRYCSFSDGVEVFLGGNHRWDWVTTYPFSGLRDLWPEAPATRDHHATRGPVEIGHDVWFGSGAVVLSGVRIGTGAVIAARAVVTRDVPPFAIVAGNPARVIRLRFADDQCAALLASAWWDLPREAVARLIPVLQSGDIEAALAATAAARAS